MAKNSPKGWEKKPIIVLKISGQPRLNYLIKEQTQKWNSVGARKESIELIQNQ